MSYTFLDYQSTLRRAELEESKKKPGQQFCSERWIWMLNDKFNVIQRPDKITNINGQIYRTHTPITHIWYQKKNNLNHHIWIEFRDSTVVIKNKIKVKYENSSNGRVNMIPDSKFFETVNYFKDNISARDYLLKL